MVMISLIILTKLIGDFIWILTEIITLQTVMQLLL